MVLILGDLIWFQVLKLYCKAGKQCNIMLRGLAGCGRKTAEDGIQWQGRQRRMRWVVEAEEAGDVWQVSLKMADQSR